MTEVTSKELEEIYPFAIKLARDAGKILLKGLEDRRELGNSSIESHVEKLNAVDLVTQTDNGELWFSYCLCLVLLRDLRLESLAVEDDWLST